ncbi:prephenate dehydrogenase/arogenate dehydrogenase family protein [bacterium]|nr:prephenate dehydrogenase/arogenate dehydrogenase family protein [bacterium]
MGKIGIVGLGLIGGSIFKVLTALGYEVCAVSTSMQGFLPNILADYNCLKDCEIVFVCTPMNKALEVLDTLEHVLSPNTIVTDVCSLKTFVCQKERPYIFIPSHPMAGTEHKGFENSFEGLFKGAKWVITPLPQEIGHDESDLIHDRQNSEARQKLEKLIKEMGALPIITTPKEHDEAVALISHMPMVVAQALFLAASENKLALKIAASGFRDMTRLAMSNEEMACDMVDMNAENIQNAILRLYKSLGDLMGKNYAETIDQIKSQREKMFI